MANVVTPRVEALVLNEYGVDEWDDITADLIRDPLRWRRGIFGFGPLDLLAGPGTFSFTLDNSTQNEAGVEGFWSPGHPNCRTGWRHGIWIRLRLTDGTNTRFVFKGRLRVCTPDPAVVGLRAVTCVARDWMDDFATLDAVALDLQENVRPDELLQLLIDLAEEAPAHVDLDTGLDEYAFAFDDLGGSVAKASQVAQDILQSEGGYLYLRGDSDAGETLRFENRHARAGVEPEYEFETADLSDEPGSLQAPSSLDHIFNDVETLTVPRRVDAAATTVLVRLDSPVSVSAGRTETLFVYYRDPDNEAVFVGGKSMVAPVVTTDWTANSSMDGAGSDLAASFVVVATYFGSRVMLELTNNGSVEGYVRGPGGADGLQCRGKGLYRYRPVSSRGENETSIEAYGRQPLPTPILMPYQGDRNVGVGVAQFKAHVHGGVTNVPTKVRIGSELSDALLEQAILRDVGDAIAITDATTGIDSAQAFIHALDQELTLDGLLSTEYTLAPADTSDVLILDDPIAGTLDDNVLAYG
ncbi:MAG: hypothetical protein Q8T13_23620 [Acidobacteriota bacterium]|nr:hypothetical protein [Acidobacteriota bacterium]